MTSSAQPKPGVPFTLPDGSPVLWLKSTPNDMEYVVISDSESDHHLSFHTKVKKLGIVSFQSTREEFASLDFLQSPKLDFKIGSTYSGPLGGWICPAFTLEQFLPDGWKLPEPTREYVPVLPPPELPRPTGDRQELVIES